MDKRENKFFYVITLTVPPPRLGFMLAKIKHQKEWHFVSYPINSQTLWKCHSLKKK